MICFFFIDDSNGQPVQNPSMDGHMHHQHQSPGHILLSELPEPPIPLSEIGPIPPPPMFSTPSPTLIGDRSHMQHSKSNGSTNDYHEYGYDDHDDPDQDDVDSDEEYMFHIQQANIDTMRIEEIPVQEPSLNAMPKKSALKKKPGNSAPGTPSAQDASNRPLNVRQDNNSSLK